MRWERGSPAHPSYSDELCAPRQHNSSQSISTTQTSESTKWAHCSASPTTTATPCTCSSAPKAGNSSARRSTSAHCRLLTAEQQQQQPTRATPNALRLLSHSKRPPHAGCQARQTIHLLNGPNGNTTRTRASGGELRCSEASEERLASAGC